MMGYYMGIDIGTSGSKGVLVNNDGDIVAQQSCEHGMEMPKPGFLSTMQRKYGGVIFVQYLMRL